MEEVKRNSLQAWILAARPKTLTIESLQHQVRSLKSELQFYR